MIDKLVESVRGKKSFLKSVSIYTFSNFFSRAIPFVLMPVLTRLLSTYDYGIIATFNAVRANLTPAISLSTTGSVCRAYYDKDRDDFDFSCFIYNALVLNIFLLVFVSIVYFVVLFFIPSFHDLGLFWLSFIPIYAFASSVGGIKEKLWIHQKKPEQIAAFQIVKALANLSLSLIIVFLFLRSWKGRVLGLGITEILFCLISVYLLYKQDKIKYSINFTYIKDILKFGLPLLPHSFGWILVTVSDRYFLNLLEGVSVTGVYGVGYAFASIVTFVSSPVDHSAAPYVFEKISNFNAENSRKLMKYFFIYFLLLILFAFILSFSAPYILEILVDKKFYGADQFVLWISLGFVSNSMYKMFGRFITYSKKTYYFAYITLTSGLVAVLANYVLIKLNGPIGAAQATFIAYTTSFLLSFYTANKLYPFGWVSFFKK